MYKSRILCLVLAILLVISVILIFDQYEKRMFLQDNIDLRFRTNFSELCAALSKDATDLEQWTAEIKIYAHTVGACFANTTYSERPQLSKVVWAICSRAELNELHEIADKEMIEMVSRLAHDIENEDLARNVYDDHIIGKKGT